MFLTTVEMCWIPQLITGAAQNPGKVNAGAEKRRLVCLTSARLLRRLIKDETPDGVPQKRSLHFLLRLALDRCRVL